MSGNIAVTPGTGAKVATDRGTFNTETADAQVVKIAIGAAGTIGLIGNSNPLPISDAGGSLTVDGTVAATQSGTWNIGSITTLPALAAGTAAIGKLAANAGVTIGAVEIAASQTLGTVTNLSQFGGAAINLGAGAVSTGTLRTTQASDSPLVAATGAVADAAWTSGSGSLVALLKAIAGAAISTSPSPVNIDQTTPGTTNKVSIEASLKSGTATRNTVNSGTTSVTILASNANRKGAFIINHDANALLLDFSAGTAAATRYQQRLAEGDVYEVSNGFTGAITGVWEADGSGAAETVEFTA